MDRERLLTILGDNQIFHSATQIDRFIIVANGCGTAWGMYRQTTRELARRTRSLIELGFSRLRLEIGIADLERAIVDEPSDPELPINLEEKRFSLAEMLNTIHHTEREFRHFFARADFLKRSLGVITPRKRDELDRQFWEDHLLHEAALDLLSTGRVSKAVLGHICSLGQESKNKLINMTTLHPKEVISGLLEKKAFELPDPVPTDDAVPMLDVMTIRTDVAFSDSLAKLLSCEVASQSSGTPSTAHETPS